MVAGVAGGRVSVLMLLAAAVAGTAVAQSVPETIYVPVTFYDILIQTNIVAPPAGVGISTKDNTGSSGMVGSSIDKAADATITLYSVVRNDESTVLTPGDGYNCEYVTWTIGGVVVGTGCSVQVKDSVARADGIKIEVTYKEPGEPAISGSTNMNVKALTPQYIHIQRTETPKPSADRPLSDDVYFNPGENEVTVYAALRDKYGNFAGYADAKTSINANDWRSDGAATWVSVDTAVATVNPKFGSSTVVHKEFMGEGTLGYLIVTYRVLPPGCNSATCGIVLSDTVNVGSKAETQVAIAVAPNPFTPGPGGKPLAETIGIGKDFYNNVLTEGGTRSADAARGALIAVDASGPLQGNGNNRFGKIIIYDAVGNVVRLESLYQADGRKSSYGYVWDGKNAKGRTVGSGSYLIRVTATLENGESFSFQRMVGVIRRDFTAGSNPAKRSADANISFFYDGGGAVKSAALSVYGASGGFVRRIVAAPGESASGAGSGRRKVGEWDLTDAKGRAVAEGSYVVKGTITVEGGKRERVSTVVGVGR